MMPQLRPCGGATNASPTVTPCGDEAINASGTVAKDRKHQQHESPEDVLRQRRLEPLGKQHLTIRNDGHGVDGEQTDRSDSPADAEHRASVGKNSSPNAPLTAAAYGGSSGT